MSKRRQKDSFLGTTNHLVLTSVGLGENWIQILYLHSLDWGLIHIPSLQLEDFSVNFWLALVSESLFHSVFLKM